MRLKTGETQTVIRGYQKKDQFQHWMEEMRVLKEVTVNCKLVNEKYVFYIN